MNMRHIPVILLIITMFSGCASFCFKSECNNNRSLSKWSGTWTDHRREDHGGDLQCDARQVGDKQWEAHFYGNCGRDYSYQVDLVGQVDGNVVKFEGDVDLGEKDGGVYNWSGTMTDGQFSGEYTTAVGKAGSFTMTRASGGETK